MKERRKELQSDQFKYDPFYSYFLKRGLDIVVSLVAMPFVLMIGIPIALLIKLEDDGDVFSAMSDMERT